MTPEALFQIANPMALLGWAALLAAPLIPHWADRVAIAVALAQSVLYTTLMMVFFTGAEGGYSSLPDVMTLFTFPGVALAGWVHYLAFDLFIGAWEVRTARREGIPHVLVVPCLGATFLFGPAGLALFFAIRAGFALRPGQSA